MKTVKSVIRGESRLRLLCLALIDASQWFSVTPYPDDWWMVRVKAENRNLLQTLRRGGQS